MQSISRRAMLTVCGAAILSGAARAENYPARPVKIVVPYPAGGSNDIIARILAQKLGEKEGQSFFVENRAGASGNIGAEVVATSAADGYTLLVTAPPPLTTNVALYKSLPFDPTTAFAPVALLATVPIVLMVHPSLPVKDVQELIALAKAKPGAPNFGSSGIGSTNHLAGVLLKSMTGWEGTCRAGEARAEGANVLVMIRPESVRLADGASQASSVLSGRVVQSSFHGARRALTVEVNGNLMRAEVPATTPLGEQVTLTIDERAAWALSA